MKKKILVWAYFTKNAGDDLFLKILFDRYPNVEWDLLTANRNYKNVFRDYKNVNILYTYRDINFGKRKLNLFFKINDFFNFKNYDALVNIGGSIFKQNKAWKIRLNEREYLLKTFKKFNKKVFVIGANFGPFEDGIFMEKYQEIFPDYDDICFRDTFSYNIFKHLDNIRVAPDVVFTLDIKQPAIKEKSVGLSLIDIENRDGLKEYYHDYNQKMIELIELYSKLKYKIKLFSFCEYEGDLKICQKIANTESFKKLDIEVISYCGNLDLFLEKFKSCEIIIGTRFHSIILALSFKQSVFPIVYSDKTFNVLKDLKLDNYFSFICDIEKLDLQSVIKNIKHNCIKNKEVFLQAEMQFEKLDLFIGEFNHNDKSLGKYETKVM